MTMRILIVCRGNTCRSAMAQGVLRLLLDRQGSTAAAIVSSAGTHAGRSGGKADPRAVAAAAGRGVDISDHRVRQLTASDVASHDLIVAMDTATAASIRSLSSEAHAATLSLLMSFAPDGDKADVPDPYAAGTVTAYEHALDLIQAGCGGLAEAIGRAKDPRPSSKTDRGDLF